MKTQTGEIGRVSLKQVGAASRNGQKRWSPRLSWALGLLILAALGCNLPMAGRPAPPDLLPSVEIPTLVVPTVVIPTVVLPTVVIPTLAMPSIPIPKITPVPPTLQIPTNIPAGSGERPVQGAVVLQNGSCCVGGVVGQEVELQIEYLASSPAGPVTEMRTLAWGGCRDEAQMAEAPWRPFVSHEQQKLTIAAINWVGYYFSVQYRDNLGNLSPVYCDDISVEGMPPPPSSIP